MEEFGDSDDEDEDIFMSSTSNNTLVDSRSSAQEFSLSLDENTTVYSADSDNLYSAGPTDAPESSATSVDVLVHGATLHPATTEDPISSSKTRIQVHDVAYTTYRAMLYYVSPLL
jgi:hypothetical protein